MNKLARALEWRDAVASGEMIETRDYTRAYLGYSKISQYELAAICAGANQYYKKIGSPLRIGNAMGELFPYKE